MKSLSDNMGFDTEVFLQIFIFNKVGNVEAIESSHAILYKSMYVFPFVEYFPIYMI